MAFHFPLANLLQLRKSQVRQQELVVRQINEEANRIVIDIGMIAREAAELNADAGNPRYGSELTFTAARLAVLLERERIAALRLSEIRVKQASATAELRLLWQRRETLEILWREQRDANALKQRRDDQRLQDDLFLQRQHSR